MADMQQGGWYNGRQYWDGQLGPVNQVMNPGESGFGKQVSEEVVKQTDPANWEYIQQQQAKASAQPSASSQPSFQAPTSSANSSGPSSSDISSAFQAPETIDLPKLYQNFHDQSGVSALEKELSDKENAFIEAKGDLNNNPYLDEAGRSGREASLIKLHTERTANLRNDIAVKKADTETQLNLELKQLDINSQATQQAWSQFNTLLSAGALDNASGEDIAGIVRSTGIPSSMIYSAIQVSKKSKEEKPNTSVIQSESDSGEVTVSVVNTDTGEIIKQTSLGKVGNAQTGPSKEPSDKEQVQLIKDDLVNDIRGGITLDRAFQQASSYLDANDILRLYNVNSIHGPAKVVKKDPQEGEWDSKMLEQYGVKF